MHVRQRFNSIKSNKPVQVIGENVGNACTPLVTSEAACQTSTVVKIQIQIQIQIHLFATYCT